MSYDAIYVTSASLKDGDVRKYTGGRTRDGLQRYLEESWKKVKPYGGLWGPDGTMYVRTSHTHF